jgi:hypothetical protein
MHATKKNIILLKSVKNKVKGEARNAVTPNNGMSWVDLEATSTNFLDKRNYKTSTN